MACQCVWIDFLDSLPYSCLLYSLLQGYRDLWGSLTHERLWTVVQSLEIHGEGQIPAKKKKKLLCCRCVHIWVAALSILGLDLHIVSLVLLQVSQINSAPSVGVQSSGLAIFGDVFIMHQTGEGFALHACARCCSLWVNWEGQWKHLSRGFYSAGICVSISFFVHFLFVCVSHKRLWTSMKFSWAFFFHLEVAQLDKKDYSIIIKAFWFHLWHRRHKNKRAEPIFFTLLKLVLDWIKQCRCHLNECCWILLQKNKQTKGVTIVINEKKKSTSGFPTLHIQTSLTPGNPETRPIFSPSEVTLVQLERRKL